MNWTRGRIIFTIVFLVLFIIGMVWAYGKDKKDKPKYFKGTWKILLLIIIVFVLYYIATRKLY